MAGLEALEVPGGSNVFVQVQRSAICARVHLRTYECCLRQHEPGLHVSNSYLQPNSEVIPNGQVWARNVVVASSNQRCLVRPAMGFQLGAYSRRAR
jgi:hypothetical protein